jgi:hypothetical protein
MPLYKLLHNLLNVAVQIANKRGLKNHWIDLDYVALEMRFIAA